MFIKRSEYEEMKNDYFKSQTMIRRLQDKNIQLEVENEKLKNIDETSETRIKAYLEKIDELNVDIANLKSNLSIIKDRFKTSEEVRNKLLDQNCRLIDLLEKYMEKEEEENESKI